LLIIIFGCKKSNNPLDLILNSNKPEIRKIKNNLLNHEVQILYSSIKRDSLGKASFNEFSYNLDNNYYYYPASTIKLPIAILAIQKINFLKDQDIPISLDTPFIAEALEDMQVFYSASTIAFVDGGGSSDTITDSANGFGDFGATDKIRVIGSSSNDGDYTLTAQADGTLTVASGSFTAETAGESVTIYQIPKKVTTSSADESSHVNLNRMLSLACVDYLKAMLADREGDIERKEYYMKEFWGKVGDNESNKRKISMSFPSSPYALR